MWKVVLPVLAAVFAVGLGSMMVGAPADIDVNDGGVQDALKFAVAKHNRGTNDVYLRKQAKVLSAQKQVVAGYRYIITVRMAKTNCRKVNVDEECAIHQDPAIAQPYECEFVVWSRPWLSDLRVLQEKCKDPSICKFL